MTPRVVGWHFPPVCRCPACGSDRGRYGGRPQRLRPDVRTRECAACGHHWRVEACVADVDAGGLTSYALTREMIERSSASSG